MGNAKRSSDGWTVRLEGNALGTIDAMVEAKS
jgi:hypothetical protein